MHAPRAKFERIYIVSPVKVAIVFLTILHCFTLFITFLTSFWIETNSGHYGPLFSCEERLIKNKSLTPLVTTKCYLNGFIYDIKILKIPLIALLIILSFIISILSIITATFSFRKLTSSLRYRYWLCTILLLLFICLIDCFIVVYIPLSHHHQIYYLQWAYGLHCGSTIYIIFSLITSILMHNHDDFQYIETIDQSSINEKQKEQKT